MDNVGNILRILRAVNRAEKEEKLREQKIVEELCAILGVTRSMIWKIDCNIHEKKKGECEIIAGVPLDINEHGFGKPGLVSEHDDLVNILDLESGFIVKNPKTSELTEYFLPTIKDKNISQILYIPLFTEKPVKKIMGIIVIDTIGDRRFTREEIEFCKIVGELVSVIIIEREDSIQKTRDEIYQQIVALELSVSQFKKHGFKMIGYASSIVHELDEALPGSAKELIEKFTDHGYGMTEFISVFLGAFKKIKKKIPQKGGKLNKKG